MRDKGGEGKNVRKRVRAKETVDNRVRKREWRRERGGGLRRRKRERRREVEKEVDFGCEQSTLTQ